MKVLVIIGILLSGWASAQNTLIHLDHRLSNLKACQNYDVLATSGSQIFRLDSSFNVLWGKDNLNPGNTYYEIERDAQDRALALYDSDSSYVLARIAANGELDWRYEIFRDSGYYVNANVACTNDGYVISYISDADSLTRRNLVVLKIDTLLNTLWCKSFDAFEHTDARSSNVKISPDGEIYILWNAASGYASGRVATLTKLTESGDVIWQQRLGGECSVYSDFDFLPNGEIVAVGYNGEDYSVGHKISVLDSAGYILSTKIRHWSDYEYVSYDTRVHARADGRYVVSLSYVAGIDANIKTQFIFFDNHKPFKRLQYLTPYFGSGEISGRVRGSIWDMDDRERLYYSSTRYSEDVVGLGFDFGRFQWYNETCDMGIVYSAASNYDYKIEPSGPVFAEFYDYMPSYLVLHGDPMTNVAMTSNFYCESNTLVPAIEVFDNHLYGDSLLDCPFAFDDTTTTPVDTSSNLAFSKIESAQISLFPNPANDNFAIQTTDKIMTVHLLSTDGKTIPFQQESQLNTTIISGYKAEGVIIVVIILENGTQVTRRIFVNN